LRKPRGGKADDGLQQRHDARIAEAQRRDPLPDDHSGLLEMVESVLGQDTVVTDALYIRSRRVAGKRGMAQLPRGDHQDHQIVA
jgi:hypothetical protein